MHTYTIILSYSYIVAAHAVGHAVYGGVERLVDMDALRRILFRARKPVPLSDLLPGEFSAQPIEPSAEREAFPVLWALKHDLLELVQAEP